VPAHAVFTFQRSAFITVFDASVTMFMVWVAVAAVTLWPLCPVTVQVEPNGDWVMVYLLQVRPPPPAEAHVPSPLQNVEEEALVPEFRFVTGKFPVTSAFARLTAELVTVWVEPAKWAIPTPGEDATTQVGHASVPVVVIGPPERGDVVAMFVTVPMLPPPEQPVVVAFPPESSQRTDPATPEFVPAI
jgi:hypothetical protein